MQRSSGILLHISSLPERYGIGTLGACAREFVDFLHAAGQSWWQMLPTGPTGYFDSPYQSFSAYAGNPYFIDLDTLIRDGLIDRRDAQETDWGGEPDAVDYGAIYENRLALLWRAFENGEAGLSRDMERFRCENAGWLEDYALFMALKAHYGMAAWTEWPEDVRLREPDALARCRETLGREIRFQVFVQFLFFRQWDGLRSYAASKGVRLMGDLPIYVAMDSADAWAEPECFLLDGEARPRFVAGVPPDYFSPTGQLWGNPVYDWDRMAEDGFSWWIRRAAGAAARYDAVRFDHFRGIAAYWRVPYGEKTAVNGEWAAGPGRAFVDALKAGCPDLTVIAEDLGLMTRDVLELLDYSGFPGMRVLQFAFDSGPDNAYLPHNYDANCVCYTGTHDNDTLSGWCAGLSAERARYAREYLGAGDALDEAVMRAGMASVAGLFVSQMQDWLKLDSCARMNIPSTAGKNWRWRLRPGECSDELAQRMAAATKLYGR